MINIAHVLLISWLLRPIIFLCVAISPSWPWKAEIRVESKIWTGWKRMVKWKSKAYPGRGRGGGARNSFADWLRGQRSRQAATQTRQPLTHGSRAQYVTMPSMSFNWASHSPYPATALRGKIDGRGGYIWARLRVSKPSTWEWGRGGVWMDTA